MRRVKLTKYAEGSSLDRNKNDTMQERNGMHLNLVTKNDEGDCGEHVKHNGRHVLGL